MRRAFVVVVGVALALAGTSEVEGQRKKKGKEPELAICERGKLIFEDDFSGKELNTDRGQSFIFCLRHLGYADSYGKHTSPDPP